MSEAAPAHARARPTLKPAAAARSMAAVKKIVPTLLAFFLWLPVPAPALADATIHVVHWNVFYNGKGTDGTRDPGRQVSVLAELDPDVITLNEVTAGATVEYAERLHRATGVRWRHHHSAGRDGGWGNAILTRHPIVSTSVRRLAVGADRSVAQATVAVNGSRVNVFATHLDSGDNARNRASQAKELLAFVAGFPAPRIVTGDMNAGPDAGEIQPLFSSLEDAWLAAVYRGTARAYPANPPHRYTRTRRSRLDYIFTSRDVTTRECAIPDLRDPSKTDVETKLRTQDDAGVRPSDHNLVSCVLAFEGEPHGGTGPPVLSEEDADDPPGGAAEAPEPERPFPDAAPCAALAASADAAVVDPPAPVAPPSNDEIVLRPAAAAAALAGNWIVEADCTAAGGAAVVNSNLEMPRVRAVAEPADYFDLTFTADAGKPYRLWVRAKAARDNWRNDSVSVQFSGAVDALGQPVYRIGTADRTLVRLEDCIGCGLSGWGWQDNGFGSGVLGPEIYFEATGPQTIRVQRREDGIRIDQIVLSAGRWLTVAPGPVANDATILPVR